jgi:multiple sugar transport system substrate-binding protein
MNPDLQFAIAPVPIVPQGQQVTLANYWAEGVSRGSKSQAESWKFLRYLSEKETMTALYKEQTKSREFGEPYSRIDISQELLKEEYVSVVIEQAPYSKTLPMVSRTFDNGLNDEIVIYLRNAVNSSINGISYKETLDTAQKGIVQVLDKFNQP